MEKFAAQIYDAIQQALNTLGVTPAPTFSAADLEVPPDSRLGDYAFPCFKLAKALRQGPPAIAAKLQAALNQNPALGALGVTTATAGPYVNFRIKNDALFEAVLGGILAGSGEGTFAQLPADTRGSWVLEYSSPNVAKPFQIYHLRPTALGAALDRIGRYRGFKVVSINHLGDWGTQYGKLAVALERYGADLPAEPTIQDLVTIYVKFHKDAESDPSLEDLAREKFRALEKGDPTVRALWKKCVDISMREFLRIYDRLGVKFDHFWGESFYTEQLPGLLADLKKRGLLVESDGAWIVNVTDREGKELPPCILEKSDGATIYATRDVAAAIYRYGKFAFDRMTYIVGGEQRLHFQQVFGVLRRMGLTWEPRCEHVPFGLYRFKDAKMSTRKGNFVTLEDTLELARDRVRELMKTRESQTGGSVAGAASIAQPWDPADFERTIEAVAVGALVFFDLSVDPVRDVEFDLNRVVDFDGETGPYLQYSHTRSASILRRAEEAGYAPSDWKYDATVVAKLEKEEELALVRKLGQFAPALERTLVHAKASQLTTYLIELTQVYGTFYRECKVLGDDRAVSRARLMLVEASRRVLARGLGLLGIPLPERM